MIRTKISTTPPILILAMGGCCGDLTAAMLTGKGTVINDHIDFDISMEILRQRQYFAAPDSVKMELYLSGSEKAYPTHWTEFVMVNNLPYISLGAATKKYADWAASRFKEIYAHSVTCPHSKISKEKLANDILWHNNYVKSKSLLHIELEDVCCGNLGTILSKNFDTHIYNEIYDQWLRAQNE